MTIRPAAITAAFLLFALTDARAEVLVDIGAGYPSDAVAVNARGQVAGKYQVSGAMHAYLWSDGNFVDLGTLGGSTSYPTAMNDAGQVIGQSSMPGDTEWHAFLYSNGVMTDLGVGGCGGAAVDINEAGQVLINSCNHVFRYTAGVMLDLGNLGMADSSGLAINDAGEVAGTSRVSPTATHAFLYTGGTMVDLGAPGGTSSTAADLNNAGQVALNSGSKAFLYSAGTTTDLGSLGGGVTEVSFLNDAGQMAGASLDAMAQSRFALYDDGALVDLGPTNGGGSFVWSDLQALNEAGQMLVYARSNPYEHALARLWSDGVWYQFDTVPVDEPVGSESDVYPAAMNDSGQIVGAMRPPYGVDTAFITLCPPVPSQNCVAAAKSSLRVDDAAEDEKDTIKWNWTGAGPVAHGELGAPDATTSYRACLYDTQSGDRRFAARLELPAGPLWKNKDPGGWGYSDADGAEDGIKKLVVKTGVAGKSKIQLIARGLAVPTPAPFEYNPVDLLGGAVTMQLRNDATDRCWSASFPTARTSERYRYQARVP
jgi:probable HAF family extracellular repeat protein